MNRVIAAGLSSPTDVHAVGPPAELPNVYSLGGKGSLLINHPSVTRAKRGKGGGRQPGRGQQQQQ
eukprot:10655887-Heterocapsa_arctica.AAC.1